MTLQIQQVSVVIAARAGQLPVYPQVGQGLLGGTVTRVLAGDSLSHHEQLDQLRIIFEREFDCGELTTSALQSQLWQSHWYRTSRKALQRAADLLVLASSAGISSGSRLAQQCEGLAAVLDSIVNAKPQAHPIADALLRGDPIPADDSLRRAELAAFAIRADGIIPAMPAQPGNCQDCNAIPTSPHGCGRPGIHQVSEPVPASPVSVLEEKVRERARHQYEIQVTAGFRSVRDFCRGVELVIDGKPHKALEVLQEMQTQCFAQVKEEIADQAVKNFAHSMADRWEEIVGGAK